MGRTERDTSQVAVTTARLEAQLSRMQIREREVLKLSGHDRRVFVEVLLRPRRPNKRLRQAARRYK
jgi:uncharacterized protein (DUF1778 family)